MHQLMGYHALPPAASDGLVEALEAMRLKIREDLLLELEEVKQGLKNIQTVIHPDSFLSEPSPSRDAEGGAGGSQMDDDRGTSPGQVDDSPSQSRRTSRSWGKSHYVGLLDGEEAHRVISRRDDPPRATKKWRARDSVLKLQQSMTLECASLQNFVGSRTFESIVGGVVLLSAIFIGIEANVQCVYHTHPPEQVTTSLEVAEFIFMLLFLAEWLLRLFVYRMDFFCMEGWKANIFDTVVLFSQIFEQVMKYSVSTSPRLKMHQERSRTFSSLLRTLRLFRIMRMGRLLRLFPDLGLLVHSVIQAFHTLLWAVLLMLVMVYAFSVFFAERVIQKTEGHLGDSLAYFFGDVPRTALTLIECILGGISWDEPIMVLFTDVGWVSGLLCIFFVAIGLFVLVNIVTGVFIDQTMKSAGAQEDRNIAGQLAIAFGLSEDGVTWSQSGPDQSLNFDTFKEKVHKPALRRYFEKIDLETDDVHLQKFFHLLDADRSGMVTAEELFSGCVRLRGAVRAMDVAMLAYEMEEFFKSQQQRLDMLEHILLRQNQSHQVRVKEPKAKVKVYL